MDYDNSDKTRTVYDEDKILDLQERVASVDGFDNVAVFFSETGRVMPYEHSFMGGAQGNKPSKVSGKPELRPLLLAALLRFNGDQGED